MARTRGGYTVKPRRSSRLRELSLPKNTITEPIDLVYSSEEDSVLGDKMTRTQQKSGQQPRQLKSPQQKRPQPNNSSEGQHLQSGQQTRQQPKSPQLKRPQPNNQQVSSPEMSNSDDDFEITGRTFRRSNNRFKTCAIRPEIFNDNESNGEDYTIRELFEEGYGLNSEQDTEEDTEQDQEEQEPAKKIQKKWKRKRADNDENEDAYGQQKWKKPILKYGFKKRTSVNDERIEGAKHINAPKNEIKLRNSPRLFGQMVENLSKEQKQWVRDAGFELLLDFNMEMLPSKLAYNVFQIFEPYSVALKLKNGDINITEEDVYDVLGLPFDGETITLGSPDKYKDRIEGWLAQFPSEREKNQITIFRILEKMIDPDVTDNFKLNFLIVLSNVLICTPTNSYVERHLLRFDDDLDNCCQYNWAEYVINCLVSGTESWNQSASLFFSGPLIFLTLLYVDRVRPRRIKLVERQFPSYKGWTEEKLKERQRIELIDGVFGVGPILQPLREVLSQDTQSINEENEAPQGDDLGAGEPLKNQNAKHQTRTDTPQPNNENDFEPEIDIMDGEETPIGTENKDPLELLRLRAQNLIEEKLLFDIDLKIELEKDPENQTLLTIAKVVDDVFKQRAEKESVRTTHLDTDFELRPEDVAHIDLVEYVRSRSTSSKCKDTDYIPSFSLGVEDDIINQVCEDLNREENSCPKDSNIENDAFFTPKPALRDKSTRAVKSPYVERVVDLSAKFTNEEFGTWRFMIQKTDLLRPIFVSNHLQCLREHMQTLKMKRPLYYSVIDTWSVILNDKENYKADDSPLRFFSSIGSLFPTLDEKKSVSERYSLFAANMNELLERSNRKKLEGVDMVFFPIHKYDHFYLICYNIKNAAYEIIDNIKREQEELTCYGEIPKMLHINFTKYLQANGFQSLAKKIRNMKPTFIKMPWQTTLNYTDCGIFLMRHMETYKGDPRNWNASFKEENAQQSQIIKLRVKYNNVILTSHLNKRRYTILLEARSLFNEVAEKKLINLLKSSSPSASNSTSRQKKKVTFASNLETYFEAAAGEKEN